MLEQEGYTIVSGEYTGVNNKLSIQRDKCGHAPFEITPKYFRSYHFDESTYGRCQQCRAELKDNEFKKELLGRTGGKFTHKGLYTDRRDRITFIHTECRRSFIHPPDMLLRYQKCPHCEYDKVIENLKEILKDNYNGNFIVLDTFESGDESVDIKCIRCKSIAPRKISSVKYGGLGCRGRGCASIKTVAEFQKELDDVYNNEYEVIKFYGTNHKTTVQHKCGHKREIMPQSIINHKLNCPNCSNGMIFWTHESYTEKIEELGNNEYKLLTEFKGTVNHVTMKHKICGHVWDVLAVSFLAGHRCPQCMIGKSHDSIKIDNILSNTDLFYLKEYTVEKCRNIRLLPFDFAIIKNKQLLLIEYDGEQHFREVEAWGGKEGLEVAQHRDQIKNQYCIDNNIPLVRIPYWESDKIEHIVRSILDYFELKGYDKTDSTPVEKYLVNSDWEHEKYLNQYTLMGK